MRRVHLVVGPPLTSAVVRRVVPTLWVSDEDPRISTKWVKPLQVYRYLGTERPSVVFDARYRIALEAFGQIAPTVQAGGDCVLLMPQDKQNLSLSHRRFVDAVQQVIEEREGEEVETGHGEDIRPKIIADFLSGKGHIAVLSQGRGRGKSAMLGMIAREAQCPVYITSPVSRSAHIALRWAEGSSSWHSADDLLKTRRIRHPCILLVDEAAGFPVATLLALLGKFPTVCAATTLHGYEGANMGFKHKVLPLFSHIHWLQKPFRASEDALESLVHSLLHVDQELPQAQFVVSSTDVRHSLVDPKDERLVDEAFVLLNASHYKTKPADLELLDKPDVHLWVSRTPAYEHEANDKMMVCVAACLVSVEKAAEPGVWLGTDRVNTEHFLPNTLAQHAGYNLPTPALRILRIVVHPSCRRSKIASSLVATVGEHFSGTTSGTTDSTAFSCNNVRSVGCVFGATPELLHFWSTLDFFPVWLASTQDKATGTFAVTCVKNAPLAWRERFVEDLVPDWLLLHSHVSPRLAAALLYSPCTDTQNQLKPLNASDLRDVTIFAFGARKMEHTPGLRRFVLHILRRNHWDSLPQHSDLAVQKVILRSDHGGPKLKIKKKEVVKYLRIWTRGALLLHS